jgi:hypothetical protein
MRSMFRGCVYFAGLVFLLFPTCTDTKLSGPSTEQGNPQIVAVVVDTLKHPVPNAVVTVFLTASNNDSTMQPSGALKVAMIWTDAFGKCTFDSLSPGIYSLKAADSDSVRSVLKTNIHISVINPPQPEFSDTLVLAVPGSIQGVVTRGGVPGTVDNQNLRDAFIQVKIGEIDRFTVTGPDGAYSFSGLPTGVYSIFYYASDGFYTAKRKNIMVNPGKDTLIDTVLLKPVPRLIPPSGFHADYDTAAAVVRLYWHKVVYSDLRWYQVKRIDLRNLSESLFTTVDTTMVDSLKSFALGDTLDYVVRSVDNATNPSPYVGPVEIIVK